MVIQRRTHGEVQSVRVIRSGVALDRVDDPPRDRAIDRTRTGAADVTGRCAREQRRLHRVAAQRAEGRTSGERPGLSRTPAARGIARRSV